MTSDNYCLSPNKVLTVLVILLLLGRFAWHGIEEINHNSNSANEDQRAYLSLGLAIREGRALTDGNRHPLYPSLLLPLAERRWSYFTGAKLVSLFIGAGGLLFVFFSMKRLIGTDLALLLTVLLSLNRTYLQYSSFVAAESLTTLCFFAAWTYALEFGRSRYGAALSALFAGLAYLSKGTGQVLMICILLAQALLRAPHQQPKRDWTIAVGVYSLISLPLWVYNFIVYHNPFYNVNTAHIMWMDKWEERFAVSSSDYPTVSSYFQTHTLSQILEREWQGIGQVYSSLRESLWFFPAPLSTVQLTDAICTSLLLLGVAGLVWLFSQKRRSLSPSFKAALITTAVLTFCFYFLLAWYVPIANAPRFFLPLVPILYATWALILRMVFPRSSLGLIGYLALLLLLIQGFPQTSLAELDNPWQSDVANSAHFEAVFQNLTAHSPDGGVILYGPSHGLPTWLCGPQFTFLSLPYSIKTWTQLKPFLQLRDIRYAIIDPEMYDRRAPLLAQFFERSSGGLTFTVPPPGWVPIDNGAPISPQRFRIFQIQDFLEPAPSKPINVLAQPDIRLIGYDLEPPTDSLLRLTLYWSTDNPIEVDYTVFVHLLNSKGEIVAQHDRAPAKGDCPTVDWPPHEVIVDRIKLNLPRDLPSDTYRLIAGMYHRSTLQRLPLFQDGVQLPQDSVLLTTIPLSTP